MSGCFVGIDCGFTGGICALPNHGGDPLLWEMPTISFEVSRVRQGKRKQGTKTELSTSRIVNIFEELRAHDPFVILEKAQVRPAGGPGKRGQGVVSQAEFFGQFTEIRGVLYAMKIPFEAVHPATWKAEIFRGQTRADGDENDSAKEAARLKAIQLFPQLAQRLALKKTHGLAEALLIACYGKRRFAEAPF